MSSRAGPDPEQLLRLARAENGAALGQLLELYGRYLALLARVQIGRRLQGKVDAADLVQETFLEAHRNFSRFQGSTEGEFVSWLRQILAANLAMLVRRYLGTRRRDVRLERELSFELDQSSRVLDQGLLAGSRSPSQQAARR
jgi:RNA polymerase sigma-70 factor (ECF subfamily)